MRTRVALIVIAAIAAGACGQTGPGAGSSPTGTASAAPETPTPSSVAERPTGQIALIRNESSPTEIKVDIYLVDASGGEPPIRLTNDARIEEAIYWLLDGSGLVYAWSTRIDPYHQTLTSIRSDGTGSIDLGPVQTTYGPSAVSPNGRYVAFGGDGMEDGSSGLVLLDLATGTRRQVTAGGETAPIWSPDGSRILALLPRRGLRIIDGTSAAVVARIDDPDVESPVGWTSDGLSVLFHRCGMDLSKTGCMNAPTLAASTDGSNVRTYDGPMPAGPSEPQLASPDRRWIASWADGTLQVTPSPGGPGVRLAPGVELAPGDSPAWSRDSMWLAFWGIAEGPTATSNGATTGLYAVRRDGGQPIRLTEGSDRVIAWQP